MKALRFVLPPLLVLVGMLFSDLATVHGWPWNKHLLELHHDGSAAQTFFCEKRATYLGTNFSEFDYEKNIQKNCLILATGSFDDEGNFTGPMFGSTWGGRIYSGSSVVRIPAKDIKARRPT